MSLPRVTIGISGRFDKRSERRIKIRRFSYNQLSWVRKILTRTQTLYKRFFSLFSARRFVSTHSFFDKKARARECFTRSRWTAHQSVFWQWTCHHLGERDEARNRMLSITALKKIMQMNDPQISRRRHAKRRQSTASLWLRADQCLESIVRLACAALWWSHLLQWWFLFILILYCSKFVID